MIDFFVSYTRADLAWAEWIAWVLEAKGFTTVIQAWDFRPGGNFVLDMQKTAAESERTVAVLSPDYLRSQFTAPEWAAAFARDPTGEKGLLLPVRVCEVALAGLLPQVVYIDLVGLDEGTARVRLLAGVKRERAKPTRKPAFPGRRAPFFPGSPTGNPTPALALAALPDLGPVPDGPPALLRAAPTLVHSERQSRPFSRNPIAFMSYVRLDDQHENGRLTQFRERLAGEVRIQSGEAFDIFQDRNDIAWGQQWKSHIEESLDAVTFLIPVITPAFFKSRACREELERFLKREEDLGRSDLILPVYYVESPVLRDEAKREHDALAKSIAARQYADWRELRFELFTSPVVGKTLAEMARQVVAALERSQPTPPRIDTAESALAASVGRRPDAFTAQVAEGVALGIPEPFQGPAPKTKPQTAQPGSLILVAASNELESALEIRAFAAPVELLEGTETAQRTLQRALLRPSLALLEITNHGLLTIADITARVQWRDGTGRLTNGYGTWSRESGPKFVLRGEHKSNITPGDSRLLAVAIAYESDAQWARLPFDTLPNLPLRLATGSVVGFVDQYGKDTTLGESGLVSITLSAVGLRKVSHIRLGFQSEPPLGARAVVEGCETPDADTLNIRLKLVPEDGPGTASIRVENEGESATFTATARIISIEDGTSNEVFLGTYGLRWASTGKSELTIKRGSAGPLLIASSGPPIRDRSMPALHEILLEGCVDGRPKSISGFRYHETDAAGTIAIVVEVSITADSAIGVATFRFEITNRQWGGVKIREVSKTLSPAS